MQHTTPQPQAHARREHSAHASNAALCSSCLYPANVDAWERRAHGSVGSTLVSLFTHAAAHDAAEWLHKSLHMSSRAALSLSFFLQPLVCVFVWMRAS